MDPRVALVMADLEQRLAEPFNLDTHARSVNLSPSRLSHLFRTETGVSPLRYLRNRRMERAGVLLERTFLSVKEVMVLVGCNDPSHFSRDFRRYHGVAPRQWRTAFGSRRIETC